MADLERRGAETRFYVCVVGGSITRGVNTLYAILPDSDECGTAFGSWRAKTVKSFIITGEIESVRLLAANAATRSCPVRTCVREYRPKSASTYAGSWVFLW